MRLLGSRGSLHPGIMSIVLSDSRRRLKKKLPDKMQKSLDTLFDILMCHYGITCVDEVGNHPECVDEDSGSKKQHKHMSTCSCVKIPVLELTFIRAQLN